jgi:signal transduction histidine kinase
LSRRPLFTPTRAVCGLVLLAALVVGGLVWVSVTALGVEAAERQAAAQADVSKRERLALWRLDSHLLPPLAVENNRPFNNYLALATPAPVVLDPNWLPLTDPGRVPSPLLSAELPGWMLLHVQLDPAGGWGSPQVLPPAVTANLRGEGLDLPLTNCTQARSLLLDDLRVKFPPDVTLRTLADLDSRDPDTAPFAVPVSLPDEPGVGKPGPGEPPTEAVAAVRPDDGDRQKAETPADKPEAAAAPTWARAGEAKGFDAVRELGAKAGGAKGDDKNKSSPDAVKQLDAVLSKKEAETKTLEAKKDPAPDPVSPPPPASNALPQVQAATNAGNPQTVNPNAGDQRANNDWGLPPEARVRKGAADRVAASRGGYETQLGGRAGGMPGGFPGGGNSGQPAPRREADKEREEGAGRPAAKDEATKDTKKSTPAAGQGGAGAPVQPTPTAPADPKTQSPGGIPGSPANPAPAPVTSPAPGAVQPAGGQFPPAQLAQQPANPSGGEGLSQPPEFQKLAEEQYRNTAEWTERLAKLMQDRNRAPVGKTFPEQTDDYARRKEEPPKGKADKPADGRGVTPLAGGKGGRVESGPGVAAAKPGTDWDSPFGPAAEPKAPPVVSLVAVRLGPLRPRWLSAADGTEHLLLVRAAALDNRLVYQGVVADWPTLRRTLTDLVADLFPDAELVPLRGGDADAPPERTMTTLPVRLDTGADPACGSCGWTPLRFGLVIAWAAAVLAIIAVAVGGRAVLAMSARRVRFASAVTHELRTPLTALQLHLDLLTSGLITDEGKKAEYLATLAAEADRLNRLVENVLDFARLEKQSALSGARPVPVADLLAAARRTWADRLRAEGFDLLVESASPPGQTVTADPRVLEQVLGNLIDNARKYANGAADRRIWVRAEAAGGRVTVEVEDRGPGVPANERRLIFKPFARGSCATDTGGAGLGLSLAKEWAELYGGSLTYRPADGGTGACFRLELPG